MTGWAGAIAGPGATRFVVWAPYAEESVALVRPGATPAALAPVGDGRWSVTVAGVGHGDRYGFAIDGGEPIPDPASGWQPDGVHGLSAVVDPARFTWNDAAWRGRELAGTVVYELHIGTFTPDGTFDAAAGELPRLAALGVTTIELMPVNAFAGHHNWGYGGVFPYAVHAPYGGPDGLARFVDAAHAQGIAVILDVVYNHLGPEGNHLGRYGPYFATGAATPWGASINVAGPDSDPVRRYFVDNAVRWIRDFHVDGFRFDAIHAIVDPTANPFWEQVCRACREAAAAAGRAVVLIAESPNNDPRELHPADRDGFGFDAVWCDDLHHSLRVAMTGDRRWYYADYDGTPAELADTIAHRWKFRGQYSTTRGRSHGRPVDDVAPHRFVVFSQNHDQVGNRPLGDRPDRHVTDRQRRFAPSVVLLGPATPMLFMGEEYGERRPFPYFVDPIEPAVLTATRESRRRELSVAGWPDEMLDPGAPETLSGAVLDPTVAARDAQHARLLAMYTELLRLRRELAAVADPAAVQRVERVGDLVVVRRRLADTATTLVANPSDAPAELAAGPTGDGPIDTLVYTSDAGDWGGDDATRLDAGVLMVAPWTVALLAR